MSLYSTIGIHKQKPHRASIFAPIIVTNSSNGQVYHAISIEVPYRSHAPTEPITITQCPGKAPFHTRDLLMRLHSTIGIHKQKPHRASIFTLIVVTNSSNCEVYHAISIEVPYRSHAITELITTIEHYGKASFRTRDLLMRLHSTIGIHKQKPHRASIGAPIIVIKTGSNGQVYHAISIEVPYRSHAITELIFIRQNPGKASFHIGNLLKRLD